MFDNGRSTLQPCPTRRADTSCGRAPTLQACRVDSPWGPRSDARHCPRTAGNEDGISGRSTLCTLRGGGMAERAATATSTATMSTCEKRSSEIRLGKGRTDVAIYLACAVWTTTSISNMAAQNGRRSIVTVAQEPRAAELHRPRAWRAKRAKCGWKMESISWAGRPIRRGPVRWERRWRSLDLEKAERSHWRAPAAIRVTGESGSTGWGPKWISVQGGHIARCSPAAQPGRAFAAEKGALGSGGEMGKKEKKK